MYTHILLTLFLWINWSLECGPTNEWLTFIICTITRSENIISTKSEAEIIITFLCNDFRMNAKHKERRITIVLLKSKSPKMPKEQSTIRQYILHKNFLKGKLSFYWISRDNLTCNLFIFSSECIAVGDAEYSFNMFKHIDQFTFKACVSIWGWIERIK